MAANAAIGGKIAQKDKYFESIETVTPWLKIDFSQIVQTPIANHGIFHSL